MSTLKELVAELRSHADPERAESMMRYFKTGKGSYGEGDKFLGVSVPVQRSISKAHAQLNLAEIQKLLSSPIHEHRLTGIFVLNRLYIKGSESEKEKIVKFYLRNTKNINNWDLVDSSASVILGNYFLDKPRDILFKLANSNLLWERRIAIISTSAFISNNDFDTALKISSMLLKDKHDLIHKAVGWMLREIGKKDEGVLDRFLEKHCKHMPRTMLRYAIEKMPEKKRKGYLKR